MTRRTLLPGLAARRGQAREADLQTALQGEPRGGRRAEAVVRQLAAWPR